MMHSLFVTLLNAVYLLSLTNAGFFRGGLMYWQTVGPLVNSSNSSTSIIRMTQRYAWTSDVLHVTCAYCNGINIALNQLSGFLVPECILGCQSYYILQANASVYRTDYSEEEQWLVSERSYEINITVTSTELEASYVGGYWIDGLVDSSDGSSELRLKLDFASHAIRRRGTNGSPISQMCPVVSLLYGSNSTIVIPVVDPDGDTVRCRWADSALLECGGVCRGFPGATLDSDHCTLTYSATREPGVYAVAIQVEDFYTKNDTKPISSSPLQFLVNVTHSGDNYSPSFCPMPGFVPATPAADIRSTDRATTATKTTTATTAASAAILVETEKTTESTHYSATTTTTTATSMLPRVTVSSASAAIATTAFGQTGNTEQQMDSPCSSDSSCNSYKDDVIVGLLVTNLLLLLIVLAFFIIYCIKRPRPLTSRDDVISRDSVKPADARQSASPQSTAWTSTRVGFRQSNSVSAQ